MTNLEIALKLREQIKEQWPHVSMILTLYENNTEGQFTERIQKMVDKLLPDEVFYGYPRFSENVLLFENFDHKKWEFSNESIFSLPINTVLFATEDNPLGILK